MRGISGKKNEGWKEASQNRSVSDGNEYQID